MNKCLMCGAENKEGAKFCCECGAKLETSNTKDGKVFAQETEKEKPNNSSIAKIRNTLIPIVVLIFTLLVAVSMFLSCGNIIEDGKLVYEIKFLENVEDLGQDVNAQDMGSLINMVVIGSYFVGLLLIAIFGIITIVKSIKDLKTKKVSCLKPFTTTLMSALQFFALFYLVFATKPIKDNAYVITYGTGAIIDIVILFITIALLTFNSIVNYIEKKEESIKTIVVKPIAMVLLAVFFLFGFGLFINNDSNRPFASIISILQNYNKEITATITPIAVIATVLQIILFYLVCGSLNGGLKNKSRSVLIVAAVFMIVLSSLVNTVATLAFTTPLMTDGSTVGSSFASMLIPNADAAKLITQGPGMKINTYMPFVLLVVAIVQQVFTSIDKKNKATHK